MAIASLVIGIINIVYMFTLSRPFFHGPTIIGIVGLVLGILALRRKARRRIAIAGIVLNAIVIFSPIYVLLWLAFNMLPF